VLFREIGALPEDNFYTDIKIRNIIFIQAYFIFYHIILSNEKYDSKLAH